MSRPSFSKQEILTAIREFNYGKVEAKINELRGSEGLKKLAEFLSDADGNLIDEVQSAVDRQLEIDQAKIEDAKNIVLLLVRNGAEVMEGTEGRFSAHTKLTISPQEIEDAKAEFKRNKRAETTLKRKSKEERVREEQALVDAEFGFLGGFDNDTSPTANSSDSAASAPVKTAKPSKGRAVQFILIDSSIAFGQKGKMSAPLEKQAPYNAAVIKLLREANAQGVRHYTVTTDDHAPSHRNFIKSLCQDDDFLWLFLDYFLKIDSNLAEENRARLNALAKNIGGTNAEEKAALIDELDNLFPFGVGIALPQLLQTRDANGAVKTLGVQIGENYFPAKDQDGKIKITSTTPVRKGEIVGKVTSKVTEVFSWPSHSFDETKEYSDELNAFFASIGVDLNDEIRKNHNLRIGEAATTQNVVQAGDYRVSVSNKGQNPAVENYSSLFSEGIGINKPAMLDALKESWMLAENVDELDMVFAGIAYDFCVKNRFLDSVNFIAPALKALKLAQAQGKQVSINAVVEAIDSIVTKRISQNAQDIKAGISLVEICKEIGIVAGEVDFKIRAFVPKEATIFILGEDGARKEMKASAEAQGVGFFEPEISEMPQMLGAKADKTMLEIASELSGIAITDKALEAALLKLPSRGSLLNGVLDGDRILARFEEFYRAQTGKSESKHEELRLAKRDALYLRFIVQEMAERSAASQSDEAGADKLIAKGKEIGIEEWRLVCQEVLGDAGNNISISKVVGKRLPEKDVQKFGALGGGLGDKITKREFDIISALLAKEEDATKRKEYEDMLTDADNVEFDGKNWRFLRVGSQEEKMKTRAQTITREAVEELGEWILARFIDELHNGKKPNLADLFKEYLGVDSLSPVATEVFEAQAAVMTNHLSEITSKEIPVREKYRRTVYKKEIEPLFKKFLKRSPEGKQMVEEVLAVMTRNPHGVETCDYTFPEDRIKEAAADYEKMLAHENEININTKLPFGRPNILFPVASSYFVELQSGTMIDKFVSGIIRLSQEKKNLEEHCVESRGFESSETALRHAQYLIQLFVKGQFGYPHEGYSQIQAAIREAEADVQLMDIVDSEVDLENFKKGFDEGVAKLVRFRARDLSNRDRVLETKYDVAVAMIGEELTRNLLPELYREADQTRVTFTIPGSHIEASSDQQPAAAAPVVKETLTTSLEKAFVNTLELAKDKARYQSPKQALASFGQENLEQYLIYLKDRRIVDSNFILDFIRIANFSIDQKSKEQKKFLTDPKFFHYFLLEFNKFEAARDLAANLKEEVEERKEKMNAVLLDSKQLLSQDPSRQFLAADLFGTLAASDLTYCEAQGWRTENEDSFVCGEASGIDDKNALKVLGKQFRSLSSKLDRMASGSTAIMAYASPKQITVASVGDSRAVVYLRKENGEIKPVRLNFDHGLKRDFEAAYIRAHGGQIQDGFLNQSLGMSRSIGDVDVARVKTSEPDFYQYDIAALLAEHDATEAFLCVACDGLYERITEQEHSILLQEWFASDELRASYDNNTARYLQECAVKSGSTDNVTVLFSEVGAKKKPAFMAVADGHGGTKVSSEIIESVSEFAKAKTRVMHKANDLDLVGYRADKDMAKQLAKKAKLAPHEILGVKADATPKEVINAFSKLRKIIPNQLQQNQLPKDLAKILGEAFLRKFIEVSEGYASGSVLNAYQHNDEFTTLWKAVQEAMEDADDVLKRRATFVFQTARQVLEDSETAKSEVVLFKKKEPAEVVNAIIKYSAAAKFDPNKKVAGTTPLVVYLAQQGETAQLEEFLDRAVKLGENFNVDALEKGKTALQNAYEKGNLESFAALLRAGADVSRFDFKTVVESFDDKTAAAKLYVQAVGVEHFRQIGLKDKKLARKFEGRTAELANEVLRENLAKISGVNSKEVFEELNGYNLVGLSADKVPAALAKQILQRKKAKSEDARVIGLTTIATQDSAARSQIPFEVVLSYKKLVKELKKDNSELVEQAKSQLAFTMLTRFYDVSHSINGDTASRTLPDSVSNQTPLALLNYYTEFVALVKEANQFSAKDSAIVANALAKEADILERLKTDFMAKVKTVNTTNDFPALLEGVKASRGLLGEGDKSIFVVFAKLSADKKYDISFKDFSYVINNIPSGSEFKEARQAMLGAYFSQFFGSTVAEIVANPKFKEAQNFFKFIREDGFGAGFNESLAKDGDLSLRNIDYAISQTELLAAMQKEEDVEKIKKLIRDYFEIKGDASFIPQKIKDHSNEEVRKLCDLSKEKEKYEKGVSDTENAWLSHPELKITYDILGLKAPNLLLLQTLELAADSQQRLDTTAKEIEKLLTTYKEKIVRAQGDEQTKLKAALISAIVAWGVVIPSQEERNEKKSASAVSNVKDRQQEALKEKYSQKQRVELDKLENVSRVKHEKELDEAIKALESLDSLLEDSASSSIHKHEKEVRDRLVLSSDEISEIRTISKSLSLKGAIVTLESVNLLNGGIEIVRGRV